MKLVHIILAHEISTLDHLSRFVNRMDHVDSLFYIHVDLKSDLNIFTNYFTSYPKVRFIRNRVDIKWAGYSMIEAELNSFKQIIEEVQYFDFLNLVSAYSYPIRPLQEFHQFLSDNIGKAFMECLDVNTEWLEAKSRVEQYHLIDFNFKGKYFLQKIINRILPKRKMPCNMIIKGRSQWFTISRKHVEYVVNALESNKKFVNFFKLTWGPDEIVFQTLLFNSPFRHDIVNNNLRYIDWSEGLKNPKTLTVKDFERIVESKKFIARKFNSGIDNEILNLIDQRVLK